MATGPKIVHKQFNSPMGLYSQQNINETLSKHLQNLDNGTVGIDFNQPGTDKPANLANSAVLRMLEEEERSRRGYPSQKKVVWPPVPETNGYHSQQPQQPSPANRAQHSPSAQQYQQPSQPPQYHENQYQQAQNQYQQAQNQYQQAQNQYQQAQNQYQQPTQSGYCEGRHQEPTGLSKLIPVGPGVTAAPAPSRQGPQSQGHRPQNRWGSAPAPQSPQAYGQQQNYQQPPHQPPQYSPQPPQYSPQPQYSEPAYPQRQFEPPATTITLRQQQPVHQQPPPVYSSQPAAASFKGGVNMRGDLKWPPQTVREAVAAENEARRQLAQGPACRPRKVKKDYSSFFAAHALNNNYPGYRAPPGTQHYEDHSGRSSY